MVVPTRRGKLVFLREFLEWFVVLLVDYWFDDTRDGGAIRFEHASRSIWQALVRVEGQVWAIVRSFSSTTVSGRRGMSRTWAWRGGMQVGWADFPATFVMVE